MATDLETTTAFGAVSGLTVLADPALKDDLSKPALALATALDHGLGQALGLGKGLTEAGIDAVATLAGDIASVSTDVAEIVGGLMQAVPIVGQLVAVVLKVMTISLAQTKTPAQRCQEWQRLYAAVPTGSMLGGGGGQPFVPADYFARIVDARGRGIAREEERDAVLGTGYPVYSLLISPSDRKYRSLLGMALMLVTEGTLIDENDLSEADWGTGKPPGLNALHPPYALGLVDRFKPRVDGKHLEESDTKYSADLGKLVLSPELGGLPDMRKFPGAMKVIYRRHVRDYYEAYAKAWHRGTEDWGAEDAAKNDPQRTKRGLPRAWRRRFRGLRRGIESLHRKDDGGTGLWILYMDLLAAAFKRGYLSRDFVRWKIIVDQNLYCVDGLAETITQMATNWSHTIEPYYAQGQAKLDALLGRKEETPPKPAPEAHDTAGGMRIVTTFAKVLFPPVGVWSALRRGSDGGAPQ